MEPQYKVYLLEYFNSLKDKDNKNKTFSGYKKSQVWSHLQRDLCKKYTDKSLTWFIELVLSGQTVNLFDKLVNFYIKDINTANPLLPTYLVKNILKLNEITNNLNGNLEIMANNQYIRNHLCEIVCILCMSNKQKLIKTTKIEKTEFLPNNIKQKVEAKSATFLNKLWKKDDCKDLYIPLNEFCYHLTVTKNINKAMYWISWVFEWYKLCRKKFGDLNCAYRDVVFIEKKHCKYFVWLIWDIINYVSNNQKNNVLKRQVFGIYKLYRMNFKKSHITSRFNFIVCAITYLIQIVPPINYKLKICDNTRVLIDINCKINLMFQKVFKNKNTSKKIFICNMDSDIKKRLFAKTKPPLIMKNKESPQYNIHVPYVSGEKYKNCIESIRNEKRKQCNLPLFNNESKILSLNQNKETETQKKLNTNINNVDRALRQQQILKLNNFLFKKKYSNLHK